MNSEKDDIEITESLGGASTLAEFLISSPVANVTESFYLSERFKNAGFKFTIKSMTGEDFSEYQSTSQVPLKKGRVKFDSKRFNECVVLNHTVEPNFKNADLVKSGGCTSPSEFLYKFLLAGEIVELAKRISALSGFDEDFEELKSQVKNS